MAKLQDAYIVAIQRTPVGKAVKGSLRQTRPDDMLADLVRSTLKSLPELDPALIDDMIIGCAMPEAEQGLNVARIAALLAGLPETTSGMTINRFCSSGLQSIVLAAQQIALGQSDVVLAGGTESMSLIPMGGHQIRPNPRLFVNDKKHIDIAYGMGLTAEIVAEKWNISRASQDQFALTSHQRACKAIANGHFAAEICPLDISFNTPNLATGEVEHDVIHFDKDEGPRQDTSLEALAKLRSAFAKNGTVTAGNSSQMSDGAGIAVLVNEKTLKELTLEPLARLHGFAVAGVAPEIMGIGPIKAIPKVLAQTGLSLDDLDWIELNEAFAAQSLAVIQECQLSPEIVNPQGGAIALGHPLGATGTIRTATLIHGLRRINKRYGMVTMCIGTGMGAAAIFEVFS